MKFLQGARVVIPNKMFLKVTNVGFVRCFSRYRSDTANSNTVNSKFHLIRSLSEDLARFLSFHVKNARLIRTRLIRSSTNSKPFTYNLIRSSCNSKV